MTHNIDPLTEYDEQYDHAARPDDLPEPGDRCKDCGAAITWIGPDPASDWGHAEPPPYPPEVAARLSHELMFGDKPADPKEYLPPPPQVSATSVRVVADYQLMSDSVGHDWMAATLQEAEDRGQIAGYTVLGSWPGAYGIQHVAFTVDMQVPAGTYEQAREAAEGLLNGPVIPDSDVIVRWLSPLG